jgi:ribosome-associated toxin RatA of RatAB toxin-antitoxin module
LTERMKTWNEEWFPCPPDEAYELACRVDRWHHLLPHYRYVRFHEGGPDAGGGMVEMEAVRAFGRFKWPVWWISRMVCDPEARRVAYTHVEGLTRGMQVEWQVEASGSGSRVSIYHEWDGGPWFCGPVAPAVGRAVVGPFFVRFVADQTLKHLGRHARKGMTG